VGAGEAQLGVPVHLVVGDQGPAHVVRPQLAEHPRVQLAAVGPHRVGVPHRRFPAQDRVEAGKVGGDEERGVRRHVRRHLPLDRGEDLRRARRQQQLVAGEHVGDEAVGRPHRGGAQEERRLRHGGEEGQEGEERRDGDGRPAAVPPVEGGRQRDHPQEERRNRLRQVVGIGAGEGVVGIRDADERRGDEQSTTAGDGGAVRAQHQHRGEQVEQRVEQEPAAGGQPLEMFAGRKAGRTGRPRPGHRHRQVRLPLRQEEADRVEVAGEKAGGGEHQEEDRREAGRDPRRPGEQAPRRPAGDTAQLEPESESEKGQGAVEPVVLAHHGGEAGERAGSEVAAARRLLDQAHRHQHRGHREARLVQLVARRHPEKEQHPDAGERPAARDRPARGEQTAGEADRREGQVGEAQCEDAGAEQRGPRRGPVVAPRVVGAEIAHRHGAVGGLDGAVPEVALVGDVEVDAALDEEQRAGERDGERDGEEEAAAARGCGAARRWRWELRWLRRGRRHLWGSFRWTHGARSAKF
jgi:hypothetical protein